MERVARRSAGCPALKVSRRQAGGTGFPDGALRKGCAVLLLQVLFGGIGASRAQPVPEAASGWTDKPPVSAREQLVVAANPLAAAAGAAILDAGGSAIDAAITTQLVLNVVEPQSSGIGGGAFIMHLDGRSRRLRVYDGRETAPAGADERLFLDATGQPMRFVDALVGGRSVGVPGVVRLLEAVHRRHGRLAWSRLVAPAEQLARAGFAVSRRLHLLLESDRFLRADPLARALYYHADGHALAVGEIVRNPALAAVLHRIAREGSRAFYEGELAQAIVRTVGSHPKAPGSLSLTDLAGYRVIEREPLCRAFVGHRVCTLPPPSSGGVTLLQMLDMLEHLPFASLPPGQLMSVHLFAEAGRLAFADRDRYLADPAFVQVPVRALLDPLYLEGRRALIDARRSMKVALAGEVGTGPAWSSGTQFELPSTTHFSIVDRTGNAVAMSSSIESAFGSRTMVEGFLLNNQLTDFSFQPVRDGARVANRVEPGKRPRSTMTPTMVFDARGRLEMIVGSPGGSWIANYVAQVLALRYLQQVPLVAAVAAPHAGSRNGATEIERGSTAESLIEPLRLLGHEVRTLDLTSGLHVIERQGAVWLGVADPRREGQAIGR